MLKHGREGYDLAPTLVDAVAHDVVIGVVGGGEIGYGAIAHSLLHLYALYVEAVVDLEIVAHMCGVERVEACLCLAQSGLQLARLQHLVRMIWRHAQRLSAVHDILAKTQGQRRYAVFSLLVANGIIVDGAQHAADVGIEASVILLAHNLLQDHSHLLLVYDVARGCHVGLRVFIIDRGIDALDGTRQHGEHGILVVEPRNHVGAVDACEGLVVGIFEQRAGAYGYRTVRGIEEGEEIGYQRVGQLCAKEMFQDLLVGRIAERYLVEVVLLHEAVEHVGTEHHGLGYLHAHTLILVEVGMTLYHAVKESQAAPLASKRAFANAGEMGVGIKLQTVKHSHHANVLHVTILHNGIEDDLTVSLNVL